MTNEPTRFFLRIFNIFLNSSVFFSANLLHTPRIQNIEYMIVDASRIVQLRVRIDHSKVKIEF